MYEGKPIILVTGDGESGKGTACTWIRRNTTLAYKKSTSSYVAPLIYDEIRRGMWDHEFRRQRGLAAPFPSMFHHNIDRHRYNNVEECYGDRSRQREFWGDWIGAFNRSDSECIALYRLCLSDGNQILDGIRKPWELDGVEKWIDLKIWIDMPGIARDMTMMYGPERCDVIIRNERAEGPHKLIERLERFFSKTEWYDPSYEATTLAT